MPQMPVTMTPTLVEAGVMLVIYLALLVCALAVLWLVASGICGFADFLARRPWKDRRR